MWIESVSQFRIGVLVVKILQTVFYNYASFDSSIRVSRFLNVEGALSYLIPFVLCLYG